jgi:cytochrome c-type biogenesis protein CcmH
MDRRSFLAFRQDTVRKDSATSPRAGQGAVGTLFNPDVAGRPRTPTLESDNDALVRNTELKLGCTCGCTLDVFTCRTTDFTCTYSPALHREVVNLFAEGKSSEAVIAAFVDKYGEKILMAPKPEGFNLAGYVVPGAAILAVGGVVAWIIRRRVQLSRNREAAGADASPVTTPAGTNAELERLERELAEMEK